MPEGLQYALSAKLSDTPRVSAVGYDQGPSLFVEKYIQEVIGNCLEIGNGSRAYIHLVLFSHDATYFQLPASSDATANDIKIYDFVSSPCSDIDRLHEMIVKNVSTRPGRTHILIMDDYAMFSIMCGSRDTRRQQQFLRLISKRFCKTFLFFLKESLSSEEIGTVYELSSDIAFLQLHPDSYGSACNYNSKFVCDLLKIREDRRVTHDKTMFQITEDEIKEELLHDISEKTGPDGSEVLKNLTTFKLTLEEGEKESKNKLHLPYFEAQKTTLQDPESFDNFEDDEEDEEA